MIKTGITRPFNHTIYPPDQGKFSTKILGHYSAMHDAEVYFDQIKTNFEFLLWIVDSPEGQKKFGLFSQCLSKIDLLLRQSNRILRKIDSGTIEFIDKIQDQIKNVQYLFQQSFFQIKSQSFDFLGASSLTLSNQLQIYYEDFLKQFQRDPQIRILFEKYGPTFQKKLISLTTSLPQIITPTQFTQLSSAQILPILENIPFRKWLGWH